MSGFNLATKPKEEQDKVALELVAREQPEHLKEYFWEQLQHSARSLSSCRTKMPGITVLHAWRMLMPNRTVR